MARSVTSTTRVKSNIVKPGDTLELAPATVVVNSDTGMIGFPHLNVDGGVSVRMLLNPSIRPMSAIQINQGDIVQKQLAQGQNDLPPAGIPSQVQQIGMASQWMKQCDGIFHVWSVSHSGDTRGNPWYTDVITQPVVPTMSKLG